LREENSDTNRKAVAVAAAFIIYKYIKYLNFYKPSVDLFTNAKNCAIMIKI